MHNIGFTDEVAQEDLFGVSEYVSGLSTFIANCNTPMTISIQGSWGTGKTSIMNFIEEELDKKGTTYHINFNAWQFTQFNLQDELAVSLISRLISQMQAKEQTVTGLQKAVGVLKSAGRVGWQLGRAAIDTFGGFSSKIMAVADKTKEAIQKETGTPKDYDTTNAIGSLKDDFRQCVLDTLEVTGKDRIIFFVDDLDRLEPKKTIEVMEVLKLFFDVSQCVFVLAIDYAVVINGLTAKYGRFSEDDVENQAKGRSFFDKMIQVPFKMPVAKYDITNYVETCFDEIGVQYNKDDMETYLDLIRLSIGTNPRKMKRLFNAFLLLSIIVQGDILEKDRNTLLLFAVLCLQHSYEGMYKLLVRNRDVLSEKLLNILATGSISAIEEKVGPLDMNGIDEDKMRLFMDRFLLMLDKSDNKKLELTEIDALKNVLGVSSITDVSDSN